MIAEALPHNQELLSSQPVSNPRPTLAQKRAVRNDFVAGNGSLVACAKRHQVSPKTAQNWCQDDDWQTLRRDFDLKQQIELKRATEPAKEQEQAQPAALPSTQQGKLAKVESQLEQVDDMLKECVSAKDLSALTQAKERLLNAWSLLTGFERPGVRRRSSKRSSYQSVQPIEPDPEPTQAMPAKPMGWEYD